MQPLRQRSRVLSVLCWAALMLVHAAAAASAATRAAPAPPPPAASAPPKATGPPPHPLQGRTAAFQSDFSTLGLGTAWGWQTGAYAKCTTNPGQFKRDVLTREALTVSGGVLTFTARPGSGGSWTTGLVTTGDSCSTGGSGVTERTGDLVVAHVRLPATGSSGAWPGVWSWRDGDNEIDLFEWHSDKPHVLEFVNHLHPASELWTSTGEVAAGAWLYVAVLLGATDDTWYVGTTLDGMTPVWSDGTGVGPSFEAYPILNLSIDDGPGHPPPPGSTPITFDVGSFALYRPTATTAPTAPAPRPALHPPLGSCPPTAPAGRARPRTPVRSRRVGTRSAPGASGSRHLGRGRPDRFPAGQRP